MLKLEPAPSIETTKESASVLMTAGTLSSSLLALKEGTQNPTASVWAQATSQKVKIEVDACISRIARGVDDEKLHGILQASIAPELREYIVNQLGKVMNDPKSGTDAKIGAGAMLVNALHPKADALLLDFFRDPKQSSMRDMFAILISLAFDVQEENGKQSLLRACTEKDMQSILSVMKVTNDSDIFASCFTALIRTENPAIRAAAFSIVNGRDNSSAGKGKALLSAFPKLADAEKASALPVIERYIQSLKNAAADTLNVDMISLRDSVEFCQTEMQRPVLSVAEQILFSPPSLSKGGTAANLVSAQENVLRTIGKIQGPDAAPLLQRVLKGNFSPSIMAEAMSALANCVGKEATVPIVAYLVSRASKQISSGDDIQAFDRGLQILAELGSQGYIGTILKATQNKNDVIFGGMVQGALSSATPTQGGLDILLDALINPKNDLSLRKATAHSLSSYIDTPEFGPKVVTALAALIGNPAVPVELQGVLTYYLGYAKTPESLKLLEKISGDQRQFPGLKEFALQGLIVREHPNVLRNADQRLQDKSLDPFTKELLFDLLAKRKDSLPPQTRTLFAQSLYTYISEGIKNELLEQKEIAERISQLAALKDGRALDLVTQQLQELEEWITQPDQPLFNSNIIGFGDYETEAMQSIEAAQKLGTPAARQCVRIYLFSASSRIQVAAAEAILETSPKNAEALGTLKKLLVDLKDGEIFMKAMTLLAKAKDPAAFQKAAELISDPAVFNETNGMVRASIGVVLQDSESKRMFLDALRIREKTHPILGTNPKVNFAEYITALERGVQLYNNPLRFTPDVLIEAVKNRDGDPSLDSRPLTVIVLPKADYNGVFYNLPAGTRTLFKNTRVVVFEAGTEAGFMKSVESAAGLTDGKPKYLIDSLFICGHGDRNSVNLGDGNPQFVSSDADALSIGVEDIEELRLRINPLLRQGTSRVFFVSCGVGEGEDRMEQSNLVRASRRAFGNAAPGGIIGPARPVSRETIIFDEKGRPVDMRGDSRMLHASIPEHTALNAA